MPMVVFLSTKNFIINYNINNGEKTNILSLGLFKHDYKPSCQGSNLRTVDFKTL